MVNKITLIGYVGRDAELRYTSSNTAVASFSVATSEKYKDRSGEKQEKTTWFTCTMWGKFAESVSQYVKKGGLVYVSGAVSVREYDTNAGEHRVSLEVNVADLKLLGGTAKAASASQDSDSYSSPESTPVSDEEIPF